ncbi:hypothetical protein [Roseomonas indoligenes]|uniref:Secreted protein n=1 Tax=Roseomonas indoligenes TaxID=2820811 RepID=A0A940MV81_9PROT|nr:hypothetical protein [Pararoseomonas indoligenes]MBP0491565.1 hypothetical protein [Pararoseomonas indoligenes]
MRVTAMMVALALAGLPTAVSAQTVGQAGPVSGTPAGDSTPAPDLPTYGRQLQAVLDKLRSAAERPDTKSATEGRYEERGGRLDMLRTMQEAVGVVRAAPADYRNRPEFEETEQRVRTITQRVQGQHEPADLNKPAQDMIQAIEALQAKVAAAGASGAPRG